VTLAPLAAVVTSRSPHDAADIARITHACKQNKRMTAVRDPNGTVWNVSRRWWPFPGDILDFTDLFELAIGLLFVVLWPFWLLGKLLGVRWVIVIERDGHEIGRELVRGRRKAKARVNEIAYAVASGDRSGSYQI
jgi:hypothetical protein